jgi:hypothetical protein
VSPADVQDANTHTTTYTPNNMDRVGSRKDALLNTETYQYDLNGTPSVFVDRKNQVASNTYDGLDTSSFNRSTFSTRCSIARMWSVWAEAIYLRRMARSPDLAKLRRRLTEAAWY